MTFSPEFLTAQKTKLEEEQSMLRGQLGSTGVRDTHGTDNYTMVAPDYGRSEEDNATEEEEYESRRGVEASLEEQLHHVDAALAALTAGTYGVCRVCQNNIQEERLQAFPAATTCMDHATS